MQVVEEKPLARIYDAGLVRWVWQFIRPYQGLFWLATITDAARHGAFCSHSHTSSS